MHVVASSVGLDHEASKHSSPKQLCARKGLLQALFDGSLQPPTISDGQDTGVGIFSGLSENKRFARCVGILCQLWRGNKVGDHRLSFILFRILERKNHISK